jgi:hypothetical protein
LSGTTSWPPRRVMAVPVAGGVTDVKFGISSLGQVTCRRRNISATTVENSVEKGHRLRGCHAPTRMF